MPLFADRIFETSSSSGTGALVLDGAQAGFEAFRDSYADGAKAAYVVRAAAGWEIGIGTLTFGAPDSLSRDTVLASSNGDAPVDFGAGSKSVLGSFPAAVAAQLATTGLGAARPFWLEAGGLWVDAVGFVLKGWDGSADRIMGGVESIAKLPGRIANNAVTPGDKIDISAGTWRAEDAARNITLGATAIDIAAGGNGGLLSGARTASTPYAVLSGINSADQAMVAGFAPSVALPAGWDAFRYHGTVYTDGSSNLRGFTQLCDRFLFDAPVLDVDSTTQGTAAVLHTLSTALGRPSVVLAMVHVNRSAGGLARAYLTHPDQSDEAAIAKRASLSGRNEGGATNITSRLEIETDAARQVRAVANVTLDAFAVRTIGWIDSLGRDQ